MLRWQVDMFEHTLSLKWSEKRSKRWNFPTFVTSLTCPRHKSLEENISAVKFAQQGVNTVENVGVFDDWWGFFLFLFFQ